MNYIDQSLDRHIALIKEKIRNEPQTPSHRFALANLLILCGDFDRALQQLQTSALLNQEFVITAQMLRTLIRAERLREQVFKGKCRPLILGEPTPWIGIFLQALAEPPATANELRNSVIDELPVLSGHTDKEGFTWFCDGDSRLGPCFELVLDGEYYWTPINQITSIKFSQPATTLDLVWAPVEIKLANGATHVAYMPARYPIAPPSQPEEDAILLGKRTEWDEATKDVWHGRGRRIWIADGEDIPMFSTEIIQFTNQGQ